MPSEKDFNGAEHVRTPTFSTRGRKTGIPPTPLLGSHLVRGSLVLGHPLGGLAALGSRELGNADLAVAGTHGKGRVAAVGEELGLREQVGLERGLKQPTRLSLCPGSFCLQESGWVGRGPLGTPLFTCPAPQPEGWTAEGLPPPLAAY